MLVEALFQEVDLRYSMRFRLPKCCLSAKVYHRLHLHVTTDTKRVQWPLHMVVNRHGKMIADRRLASLIIWMARLLIKNHPSAESMNRKMKTQQ